MPLVAQSDTMLAHITDVLHDLYFEWAEEKLRVRDGTLSITLYDKDNLLDSERTLAFRLCVQHIENLVVRGSRRRCLAKKRLRNSFSRRRKIS